MRSLLLALTLGLSPAAFAQDAQLAALHASLVTLNSQRSKPDTIAPAIITARHQLRDWIETQLATHHEFNQGEDKTFADQLNKTLESIRIPHQEPDPPDDPSAQSFIGSLDDVTVTSDSGLLLIQTSLGIVCGSDDAFYAYKLLNGSWKRVIESENTSANLRPHGTAAVYVWQDNKDGHESGPAYVMALGNNGGCTSFWRPVDYHVWRVSSSESKPLIDGSDVAHFRGQRFIVGSLSGNSLESPPSLDVIVEFTKQSIDAFLNRESVHHYQITGDHVLRTDPVALSPRDFVDEWLTSPWKDSVTWSASASLQPWHQKLHADWVGGDFTGPTLHCQVPDLWQVAFAPSDATKNFAAKPPVYFLVRWRPPYRFTMADLSDQPSPSCTQPDPEADQWRTLFNTQEWRW